MSSEGITFPYGAYKEVQMGIHSHEWVLIVNRHVCKYCLDTCTQQIVSESKLQILIIFPKSITIGASCRKWN